MWIEDNPYDGGRTKDICSAFLLCPDMQNGCLGTDILYDERENEMAYIT